MQPDPIISAQIQAITKKLIQGKAKNKYAAIGKIKRLQNKVRQTNYYNFLAN